MSVIQGQEGISILDAQGGYIALSVKEQVMRNLKQSLATFLQARSAYSGDLLGNGTIYYRIPLYGSTQEYSQGQVVNVNPVADHVVVNITHRRTQFYEIEDFDTSMIKDASALVGMISANLSTTILADQNAHFFLALKEFFDKHPEQTLYIPNLVNEKVLSENEYREIQKDLMWAKAKLTRVINKKYIGVNSNEFYGIVDTFGRANVELLLTTLNLSNSAFNMIIKGIEGNTLDSFVLGGTRFFIDNFVNRTIPQGNFNGDYNYDMSDYLGFIIHNDFIAFPMGINSVRMHYNQNNNNPRWIAKYCFGSGVLRPELGTALVKEIKSGMVHQDAYYAGDTYKAYVNTIGSNWTLSGDATNCEVEKVGGTTNEFNVVPNTAGECSFTLTSDNAELAQQTITFTAQSK